MLTVVDIQTIVHLYRSGDYSRRGIARKLGISRTTVDKVLAQYEATQETSDNKALDNLLKTLQVYLETCLQYEKTARQLFVHKNTVRYRIAKCQKFLNTDFTDGKKNFQYTLSLKILEYYHYIE